MITTHENGNAQQLFSAPLGITACIENLLLFAEKKGILHADDVRYARNALLYALKIDQSDCTLQVAIDMTRYETATPFLSILCQYAVDQQIIENTSFAWEQFAAHLMNLLTPLPSQINETFQRHYQEHGSMAATDWFYAFCRANDTIRVDEIKKNIAFEEVSSFGKLQITINLSKPEKHPNEIARLRTLPPAGYPTCMLCAENEGYAGRFGYPSHETLRTIPIALQGERWRFQYSPYSYFAEHCIALNELHVPMQISKRTFSLLLALIDLLPHYFFGSNADLPIVGGSILSHDHFQGGRHVFPMDMAPAYAQCTHPRHPDVTVQLVRWPMTCIRLLSAEKEQLINCADALRIAWLDYDDVSHAILSHTDSEPHNTITPIARMSEDGRYILQLVLRNNRTSEACPLGIFHPHANLHHIKQENIGLIEVMGLFILPGRLQNELLGLEDFMTGKRLLGHIESDDPLAKHVPWASEMMQKYGTALKKDEAKHILQIELTQKCANVLADAGVYTATPEGDRGLKGFLEKTGFVF